MQFGRSGRLVRLRRMGRMPLVSPRLWWRRAVFWVGAVLVAAVAVGFAKAADMASGLFLHVTAGHVWLPFIIASAGLTIAFLLTKHVFPGGAGQWRSADHRGVAYARPGHGRSRAVPAHRRRQSAADAARLGVRCVDWA